jgi:hypothetical protein
MRAILCARKGYRVMMSQQQEDPMEFAIIGAGPLAMGWIKPAVARKTERNFGFAIGRR